MHSAALPALPRYLRCSWVVLVVSHPSAGSSWRWRSAPFGTAHDRFWLQLIRHAAGEPYGARSERLSLDIDQVSFEVGQSAQAKVRTAWWVFKVASWNFEDVAPASPFNYCALSQ